MTIKNRFLLLFITAAGLLWGCAIKPSIPPEKEKPVVLRLVPFESLPVLSDDMALDALEESLIQSLSYLRRLPGHTIYNLGGDQYDAGHMVRSLERFLAEIRKKPNPDTLSRFLSENYRCYQSVGSDGDGSVLFTGYYEPVLDGSTVRSESYRFPIYEKPDDLLSIDLSPFSPKLQGERIVARLSNGTIVPYHDRREIDLEGALQGKARVIAWVQNPLDLFFLQIQGSGRIFLKNGQTLFVHYHTSNGRPYRSVGKLLIDSGKISREDMSMQSIRRYLTLHPEEIPTVLAYNPSYVFFKIETDGPIGFLETRLTPGRSIALDRRIFPSAALAVIQTQKPIVNADGGIQEWTDFSRFVLNQDTGGAIQGPGRADLFWGNGSYAEVAAGHMRHEGKLFFLVLKPEKAGSS